MIDVEKQHHADLMIGVISDYQTGKVSLRSLIMRIEQFLAKLDDPLLNDGLFSARIALDEVYARCCLGNFDFIKDGEPVVSRAIKDITTQIELYSKNTN